jgi:hypothetical protein
MATIYRMHQTLGQEDGGHLYGPRTSVSKSDGPRAARDRANHVSDRQHARVS